MKTAYIVQSFTKQGSQLITDTPIQCSNADEAIRRADKFADIRAGVIAISQEYDEETGDFGELKVLAKYGEIPAGAIGDED
ncbi:MAG TPA: hypothetical protein H9889_10150 [Candidatus Ignatzschineria merdigallinarum]|uniref:Uncharacterized protein n=1 Tax=Candidatus Ignatzschineria merdigallinarum TaxID=2838621 RepID=A0A9D1TUX8_9GAMM|nr:hypothetical protein [Candidatus Ignatzschineria merdigallinarum]